MDIFAYLDKGGAIAYLLLAMNLVGYTIMIWKFFEIKVAKSILGYSANQIKKSVELDFAHPLYATQINIGCDLFIDKLEARLNIVRIIAVVSPLLGLLGTVTGILISFESIATYGLGNPAFFAVGISGALVSTMCGLLVAIPHYIGYNYFVRVFDTLEIDLKHKALN